MSAQSPDREEPAAPPALIATRALPAGSMRRREVLAAGLAMTAAAVVPASGEAVQTSPERGQPFDDGTWFDDGTGWVD